MYVYFNSHGYYQCQWIGHDFWVRTPLEMISHLEEHRIKGDKVPQDVLDTLKSEISNPRSQAFPWTIN